MFSVRYTNAAMRDVRKLAYAVRVKIEEAIAGILENPYAGKKLHGSLSHWRSTQVTHRATAYRIAYEIIEDIVVVEIVIIGKREGFYQRLERRLRGRN